MGTSILRALMVLGAIATVAAACGDAPTAAPPPEARLNTGTAVSVTLTCGTYQDYGGYGYHSCDAYASGGSGLFTFTWFNAIEDSLSTGYYYSRADVVCDAAYPGPVGVWVTATDWDGRSATAYRSVSCGSSGWGPWYD